MVVGMAREKFVAKSSLQSFDLTFMHFFLPRALHQQRSNVYFDQAQINHFQTVKRFFVPVPQTPRLWSAENGTSPEPAKRDGHRFLNSIITTFIFISIFLKDPHPGCYIRGGESDANSIL